MFAFTPPFMLVKLLLLLHASLALATHQVCDWQDQGPLSPSTYGYRLRATAPVTRINDTHAKYVWHHKVFFFITVKKTVADYGFTAPQVLEFAKPCHHGYDICKYRRHYGVCNGTTGPDMKDVACKYMYHRDDCEWPVKTIKAPESVEIWRKRY